MHSHYYKQPAVLPVFPACHHFRPAQIVWTPILQLYYRRACIFYFGGASFHAPRSEGSPNLSALFKPSPHQMTLAPYRPEPAHITCLHRIFMESIHISVRSINTDVKRRKIDRSSHESQDAII